MNYFYILLLNGRGFIVDMYNSYMKISAGIVHKITSDIREALISDSKALATWEDLTPLARNEWICWAISVKREETRAAHVERMRIDLHAGKRRPCCWYGCIHRKDKKVSPSVFNLVLKKRR